MKRTVAFIFIVLSALIFVLSYLPAISQSAYASKVNITGQAGMSISILLFFIFSGKKKQPRGRHGGME